MQTNYKESEKIPKGLSQNWFGVRQGVEVPQNTLPKVKDLGFELIDRWQMWDDNYYKYEDWKEIMSNTYDSLNLNVFPL